MFLNHRALKSCVAAAILGSVVVVSGCANFPGSGTRRDADGKPIDPNQIEIEVAPGFKPAKQEKVGFIIRDAAGRVSQGETALGEAECINALMRQGYSVVERAALQAVLKEQQMGRSGLFEDGDALNAGKLRQAKAVILVTVAGYDFYENRNSNSAVSSTASDVRLTARWLDVESGTVKWSATTVRKSSTGGFWGLGATSDVRKELTEAIKGMLGRLPVAGS